MPSHSHNPKSTRRPRRWSGWTALVLVLLLGYVVARPHLDEVLGVASPQATDNPTPTGQSSDGLATEWKVDIRPDSGFLTQVRPRVFQSPAGLIYGPGSAEGNRLNHVLRHAADDPDRPVHGVFDGNREDILAVLDEAYRIASKRGPPVDVEQEGRRTVYTIDMGRRVGYVGGAAGERNGHPAATHIRLVLEGRDVITAFPLKP
jgi:hypothetical protein